MIEILHATHEKQIEQVRQLMRAFVSWQRIRNAEDMELVNEYFNDKIIEEELASLPGKYGLPGGRLLLALFDDQPAGCVALREIDKMNCEMKRMFVCRQFHGKGIALAMAAKLISEAKDIGYKTMWLDTSFRQTEAQSLYQKIGFKKTAPYYELPKKVEDWLVFMALELK